MSYGSRKKTSCFEYNEIILSKAPTSMVLFHGFGADCDDLVGVLPYLKQSKVGRFILPNGVIPANSLPMGRAWFPIDVAALEVAMMTGKYRDFSGPAPKALETLCNSIEKSLVEELGISPSQCILGGFSQGAMLASHLMLNSTSNYKALVILSGAFLDRANWTNKIQSKPKKPPVFISHGDRDALLNPQDALALFDCFRENAYNTDFHPFEGGHEIPLDVISKLSQFLDRV